MSKEDSSDEEDFASLMAGVKRLRQERINQYQHRPAKPAPGQRQYDSQITDFGELSYQQAVDIRESWFDHGIQKKLQRRIRQGLLTVDNRLDLHGYTQRTAGAALTAFLHESLLLGHKLLIIIHGKGQRSQNIAVLKPMTLHWLSQQKSVLAWCPAQPRHGGTGASYVYLR